jgi:metal-sulfur cluster biosynthetic enzyme
MSNVESTQLRQLILERLRLVIDPETNVDVVRMRLVEDIRVDSDGSVAYTFHPSSPFCPIAVYLIQQIKSAVSEIPGIVGQKITVTDYVAAEQLTNLINKETTTCE